MSERQKQSMSYISVLLVFFAVLFSQVVRQTHAEDGGPTTIQQGVADAYRTDRQTTYFRSGVTAADAAATTMSDANLAACGEFDLNTPGTVGASRQTVSVSARFSAASRSCKVRWVAGHKTTAGVLWILGMSDEVTLTGTSAYVRDTRYPAPTCLFDSYGGNVGYLVVTDPPASGTVSFAVGSY